MARLVPPLTVTKINAAKPKEKLYKLSDGSGLALWIYPSGKKTWRFEYRRADKKLDTITFGSYPELSLADAREKRDQNRSMLAKNIDPKLVKDEEVVTLNTVFDLWYVRWYDTVSDGYAKKMHRVIEKNIQPILGNVDVTKIEPKDVVEALTPLETRGSLEQLRKAKRILGQIFDFAVARGLRTYNPVTNVSNKAFKEHISHHHPALKPKQLPELLQALYHSGMDLITRNCIMLALLTLSRPAEATNAAWKEINLDKKLWTIEADRMKGRKGRKVEHDVYLSTLAMEILEETHQITGHCHYVFVARDFRSPINRETPLKALRRFKHLGLDTTSHGLRALARTYLQDSGIWRFEAMEAALAHKKKDKTVSAYDRAEYEKERRKMLEWWGEEVRKHMDNSN